MSDTIEIKGLRVLCHVGVPDAERSQAQPIEFDLELGVDLSAAASSDDVADTVDYGAVAVAVEVAVRSAPASLLEHLAAVAIEAAFAVDDRTRAVGVTVRKLRPPVPVDVGSTAVRMRRTRA